MANLNQSHFRFGKEELLEATHGWWQVEDINHTQLITANWAFLLRFCEQVTTAISNVDAQFQYNKNGAGWVDITTTSSVISAVASVAFTNGQACTKRLSGTGTFETSGAGCTEDGSSGGTANDIVLNGNSETEAGLQVINADVANGDTIQFRLTSPDATMVYLVTPTLTIEKAGATSYKTIAATAIGSPVLSRRNNFYRTLAGTATGVAVLSRPATLYRAISAAAVGVAVVSTAKMFSKAIDAVAQGVATLTKATTYRQLISATAEGISALTKTATYYLSVVATATGVVTLTKTATHYLNIGVVATGVIQLIKGMSQTLSATAEGIATLTNALTASRTLEATAIGQAILTKVSTFALSLATIAQGVAELTKEFIQGAVTTIRGWFSE